MPKEASKKVGSGQQLPQIDPLIEGYIKVLRDSSNLVSHLTDLQNSLLDASQKAGNEELKQELLRQLERFGSFLPTIKELRDEIHDEVNKIGNTVSIH